ncbi:hypothetical protein [Couchioplanes azureus]|uniref:hypothetical protein n=1 Tax=Couchioplanes caeruleus TaxID=56438 RepID=UPI0019C39DE3|nr:hypothetical protein [Couchioplanes caeruleus]GGQ82859.1 hypothetical protein GCM10010166_61290 [Couchioplanes caeruleus subsp. azureus]
MRLGISCTDPSSAPTSRRTPSPPRAFTNIWANEMPEPGQGPAVGRVVFTNLTLAHNAVDIRNTTSTFTIVRN